LENLRDQLARKQTQLEYANLLTEIYGKIDYESIDLPREVVKMFVDEESWVWALDEIPAALVQFKKDNPLVRYETPVANMAQRRVDSLRDPETAAFYAWFRSQTSFDRSGGGANPSFPGMPAGLDFPNPGGASRDPKLPNGLRDLPAFPDTTIPAPFSFPGLDLGGTTDDTERPPNPEIPIESNDETPGTDSP
jgi:hypothetical protein